MAFPEKWQEKWVTDITSIPTSEGWLYVAAIIDLFSRRGVGRAMSSTMATTLVLSALDMALGNRLPGYLGVRASSITAIVGAPSLFTKRARAAYCQALQHDGINAS